MKICKIAESSGSLGRFGSPPQARVCSPGLRAVYSCLTKNPALKHEYATRKAFAQHTRARWEYKTSTLSSLMESLFIIFLGLIVGVILISMYLLLFQMSNNFQ